MTDQERYEAAYDWHVLEMERRELERKWDNFVIATMELDFLEGGTDEDKEPTG